MKYSEENGDKSRNGNRLENYFVEKTGLNKFTKKQKPSFINSHGKTQVIDFDFHKNVEGVDIYMDLTTTYRSDRLKQKAYNALMYKSINNNPCKFYMVVGSLIEHGKKKNPILIEGIDGVITMEDAINLVS
jgi:hypothetical protein